MRGEGFIKKAVEWVYKRFETGSGAMILITSITGMALSTIAQTVAIILNKKYTDSQKAFMIPQELTDGLINIFSMFLITKPFQKLSSKLVKAGKIATKEILEYLKRTDMVKNIGEKEFDIGQSIRRNISNIEKSDVFIKLSDIEKAKILTEHRNVLDNYEIYSDSISALATTTGAVLSTALIAPVVRNSVASRYQKLNINKMTPYQDKNPYPQNGRLTV